jgi:hypothetical protein
MGHKVTTAQFIEQARAKHGDLYGYSLVDYVNCNTKVKIVCKTHGTFEQSPMNHLSGKCCFNCAGSVTLTTDQFIERARAKHGDKYDYGKVVYVNSHVKVDIICKVHGIVSQLPRDHLKSQGCPECWGGKKSNTTHFIEKARLKHGDLYDYSLVNYLKSSTKVKIICKEHGVFEQTPNSHLSGRHCAVCAGNTQLTSQVFIKKAQTVHGDSYDYSLVNYTHSHSKVEIICKHHGIFLQTPDNHSHGKGCPDCGHYGYRPYKPGTLYYVLFNLPGLRLWKIGITNRTVKERFYNFGVDPIILWERRWDNGSIPATLEKDILSDPRYASYRYKGDALLKGGGTECFTIDIMALGNTRHIDQLAA